MEKLSFKINNLAIQSENKSAAGDAFIAEADKKLQEKLGTIFGIVELFALPDEFSDGFFEIINDLKTEYYLPPFDLEMGTEKRFEECLQRTNRRIHKLVARSVQSIALEDINATVGLVRHGKICLSQIGAGNALLFHQKRDLTAIIIDIFDQTAARKSKIDPEKMFSNIISGQITAMDELLLCNDTVLEYLSQIQLSEIILDNDIFSALNQLERELQPHSANNNFYSIIIEPVTINTPSESANRPGGMPLRETAETIHPQTSINRLLNTQTTTEQYLTPSLMPNWKKVLLILLIWMRKLIKYLFKYGQIGIKKLWRLGLELLQPIVVKLRHRLKPSAPLSDPILGESVSNDARRDGARPVSVLTSDAEKLITKTPAPETRDADMSQKIFPTSFKLPIKLPSAPTPRRISDFLNDKIAKFVALSIPKKLLVILAFILIFFFSQSIVMNGQAGGRAKAMDIQNITAQAIEAINSGQAQNIFNDQDGATLSLQKATEFLNQIPDKRQNKAVRADLQNKIDQLAQLLQKIVYITSPETIADLGNKNPQAQTAGLTKINNLFFTFDNQNHTLYKIDVDKKQTISIPLDSVGNIKKLGSLNDKSLVLLNDKNEFYQYDMVGTSTKKILAPGTTIADFDIYGGKIYTLQPDKNQIFKHLASAGGFNSGSGWVLDGTSVKDATAVAIADGAYLAKTNGTIIHLISGRNQSVAYSPIAPPLKSPTQIYADLESNFVFILDPQNQRVVVYDKTGTVKIQYQSKEFTNIKSMAMTPKEKKIYILSGNKAYAIATTF